MFLSGVIEGFYGPLWTVAERRELLDSMQAWGLNTYVYGPKDDLHHRVLWRECYGPAAAADLGERIRACAERGIRFLYALGPGLDIRYGADADFLALRRRLEQLFDLGCRDFGLLFDDIPDRMHPGDAARWGHLASAQCDLTHRLRDALRERGAVRFHFCPTPYCGRMVAAKHGGEGYLETVGRELDPEIPVFWTGPEIVSERITLEHAAELARILRRPPLIWDNLHANDYDGRRLHCGPYSGRPPGLRGVVAGVLCNPNTEFPANFPALHTFAAWVRNPSGTWDPAEAQRSALSDWLPRFASAGQQVQPEDLALFCDVFHLPYSEGPGAEDLRAALDSLLADDPASWSPDAVRRFLGPAARLRDFCVRVSELRDRTLFQALHRRVWELREELDLDIKYVEHHADPARRGKPFHSDFHLPKTYRGGFVSSLQSRLLLRPDGSYIPSPSSRTSTEPGP
jgi:protein O-GlcNAcase/histone acetyltransferase